MKLRVAADVFDSDGDLKIILHLTNACGGGTNGLEGVRKRKKIVSVAAVNTSPAKMIRQPRRLGAPGEIFQALEMLAVERLRRTEVHGNAMLHNVVLVENLVQYLERISPAHHVVFRDDLEPIHNRLLCQDMV